MVHCPRHHAHTILVQVFSGGLCSIHDIFEQLANENTELHCVPPALDRMKQAGNQMIKLEDNRAGINVSNVYLDVNGC